MISFSLASNQEWRDNTRAYVLKMLLNSVVVIAIFLLMGRVFLPFLLERQFEEGTSKIIALSGSFVLSSPFLWALAFGRTKNFEYLLAQQSKESHNIVFLVSRIFIVVCLVAVMVAQFISAWWGIAIVLAALTLLGYVSGRRLRKIYQWIENHFLENLEQDSQKVHVKKHSHTLAPWDGHMTEFVVPSEADYVGRPLSHLGIRERFGVTIALIERGRKRIAAPEGTECLMPQDKVFTIGTDEQLAKFRIFIEFVNVADNLRIEEFVPYSLEQYLLNQDSSFVGKSIRESGLREKTQGLVVGIEREGQRILNPETTVVLNAGDVLWIVGDRKKIGLLV